MIQKLTTHTLWLSVAKRAWNLDLNLASDLEPWLLQSLLSIIICRSEGLGFLHTHSRGGRGDRTVLSNWMNATMSVYTHTDTKSICSVPTHDWIKVQWKIQRSVIILMEMFGLFRTSECGPFIQRWMTYSRFSTSEADIKGNHHEQLTLNTQRVPKPLT